MNYCIDCGTQLQIRKPGQVWYCPNCKRHHYANPIVAVDAVLFDEQGRVLLGRRRNEPDQGKLNLPGGFVEVGETIEEGIERELEEELHLKKSEYNRLIYSSSMQKGYTQEGKTRDLIVVIMLGKIKHRDYPPNEEVLEYVWKKPNEIQPDEVTIPSEYDQIQTAAKSYLAQH